MRVLVVEDQPKLRDLLSRVLTDGGYEVDAREDGVEALRTLMDVEYDAVVLDLMLPKLSGLDVLRAARARNVGVPVLVLTARDSVRDRVTGLDAGADDYLIKPFAMAELLGRIRALLRRGGQAPPSPLECGPLSLDPSTRGVTVDGAPVELSPREFALLEYLMMRAGKVVTRDELLDHVWGNAYEGGSNVVDVYIKYLRDKIDRRHHVQLLRTVRGAGYRLGPDGDSGTGSAAAPADRSRVTGLAPTMGISRPGSDRGES